MSLIIATGSNLGNAEENLAWAKTQLARHFHLIAESRVYVSAAVDYEEQPKFFNQVLEFRIPEVSPESVLERLLSIEAARGRVRDQWRGPRTLDLDIILWGLDQIRTPSLEVPHPRWTQRSFVVRPLSELPFFHTVKKCFTIPASFTVEATPVAKGP